MKFAISGLTFKQVLRCITSAQLAFEELEVILAWGSRDRAHCQHLESSAHCRDFTFCRGIQRGYAHAATRQGFEQSLGFELSKCLAHGSLADGKFPGQIILPEALIGCEVAVEDASQQGFHNPLDQPIGVSMR